MKLLLKPRLFTVVLTLVFLTSVSDLSTASTTESPAKTPSNAAGGQVDSKEVEKNPAEKAIVSLDDILVKMEKALSVINSTDTDVVKEDKLSRATDSLQTYLSKHRIAITVHIGNVAMKKNGVATLSLHDPVTLKHAKLSNPHRVSASPSGAVQLTMTKEQAIAIKPGQTLTLIGEGSFVLRKDLFAFILPSGKYEIGLHFADFPFKTSSQIVLTPTLYSISNP